MKLKLVKQGEFLGTKCDFYRNEKGDIFMSRTQIGYALEYKNPQKAIKNIHSRSKELLDKYSIKVPWAQFVPKLDYNNNGKDIYMYNEQGIYTIVGKSQQPKADEFNSWVADVIFNIRKNGYYIATEKDKEWLGARQEGKEVRKEETDIIKKFVEYAIENGSKNANRYYSNITKLVNKLAALADVKNPRDYATQKQLRDIMLMERAIEKLLLKYMATGMYYKDIYQEIKNYLEVVFGDKEISKIKVG